MKILAGLVITIGMCAGYHTAARADSQDISFADSLAGVDGSVSGWSAGDALKDLGTKTWSLLGGGALARAFGGGDLTHRLTRGLGISGGEYDEIDHNERMVIRFLQAPFLLDSFEVRSLFKNEPGGDERGRARLFLGDELVTQVTFSGDAAPGTAGSRVISFDDPYAVDRIVFLVPHAARAGSEFALARLSGTVVPEPVSALLFLTGGGALAYAARRRKK